MSKIVPGYEGMVAMEVGEDLAPGRLYWLVGMWPIGSVPNPHYLCESVRGNYGLDIGCMPYKGSGYTDEITAERGFAYVFVRPGTEKKLKTAHLYKILRAFKAQSGGVFAGGPIDTDEEGPLELAAEVFAAMSDTVEDYVRVAGDALPSPKTVGYVLLGAAGVWLGWKVVKAFLPAKKKR